MRELRLDAQQSALVASLRVDGRLVTARPMRGSGVGEAHGLAVVATNEREVLDASAWLPGRILVLAGESITRSTVPLVVKGAHMATFAALVVITDDLSDLGHMGESGLPVPVVFVSREEDHSWMRKAVRVTVSVGKRDDSYVEVRAHRPERRRRMPAAARAAVPGVVRR